MSFVTDLFGGGSSSSAGQQSAQIADPFMNRRGAYGAQLDSFMKNPSSVTSMPGYQQQQQAGMDQVMRSHQAGGAMGGGENIALQQQGQSTLSSFYNNALNSLAQFSGASWQSGPAAAAASNQAQNQTQSNNWGMAGAATSIASAALPSTFLGDAFLSIFGI